MTQRHPYLAAYDVTDPRRLRQAQRVLRGYATGGQRSVFECPLSAGEKAALLAELAGIIDPQADRFFLVRLDPRRRVHTLGVTRSAADLGLLEGG